MKPETVVSPLGIENVLIHYIVEGRIACMPNLLPKDMSSNKERAAPHMRTDAKAGVTCPMCKRTKEWTS